MSYLTAFVYTFGSYVCHQIPERSFHIAGVQLPVCARCTGLYVGGLIGLVLWMAGTTRGVTMRAAIRGLALAAAPTVLTVVTAWLGWWDPTNVLRAILAGPLGITTGAVVATALAGDLKRLR